MATTKRKSTVHPAACPRAIALAVATAFLPWYLPQPAYAQAPDPNTLPTGGQITNGAGQIHAAQGTHLQIDQYTQRMIAEFGSFSIGANASVNLSQPGASSIALFRDVGGDPSKIFGNLTANGQLFIANQNGVLFGASARVDVGALFATSLSITDQDFMAGRYHWHNEGNAGSVVNQGQIVTANGYTALVGPQVRNDGIIVARAGSVALAAGDRVSLDMIGDGLISVSVDQSTYNASVINTGSITADGGTVLLTARSANALLDTVINNSGTIRANSLVERNGEIVLDGGDRGVVSVTGTLQAAGLEAGTTGGTIKVLGDKVGLFGSARIDASGDVGGGTVLVGGNWQGQGPERNASAAFMSSGASILADARTAGDGGTVVVWSDGSTRMLGSISARGGEQSGNGGSVETSGHYLDVAGARVDTSAPNGTMGGWLLDPFDITVVDGLLATSNNGAFGGGNPNTWTPNATGSTVADADIAANLVTANVTITTVNGAGAENGDITINSDVNITWATANTLTFNAERSVTILGNATFIGATGTLAFNVGQANGGGVLTIPGTATLSVATVNALGGTGNDNFNIGAWGAAGSVNGAAGNDTFNINTSLTANLAGGADADSFVFANGTVVSGTVDGGGGSDTLDLSAYTTALTVNLTAAGGTGGANGTTAGTPNPVSGGFSNIDVVSGGTNGNTFNVTAVVTANLSGGAGADVFNIDAALTGSVSGVGGSDTLQGTQIASTTLTASTATDGFSGTTTGLTGFSGINVLNGSGTLTGRNVASTWSVDGATYTDGTATLSHSGFGTLQGGTGIDTFNLAAAATANLMGGDGVDVFALGGNTLTGAIAGQAAGGSITGLGSATLTNAGATTGFDGTSANVSGNFTDITSLSGNGTLTGDDVASTWALDGTPTYSDGTRTLDIAGFASLQGGTAVDTFNVTAASAFNLLGGAGADVFTINAALTGSVSGETGSDTLQGTQIASTTLTASTATDGFSGTTTGLTGFSGINVLNSSGTLTGRNVASTWSVDGATYTDGTATLSHSGFGTLQGGTGIDTFNLAAAATANLMGGDGADVFNVNAALTGSVNGEVGDDTLSGGTIYVVNAVNAGTASNVSGGFSNIENLVGTAGADTFTLSGGTLAGTVDGLAGTDTLTGDNVANTWTITGPNSGTLTGTGGWLNIENLVGGTSTDGFSGVLAGSVDGTISDGGGGATTLSGTINSGGSQTYSAAVSSAGVTLNAGTAAISATNAGNNFTGPLSVTGSSASITDMNALTIGANLTGALTTVSGALTYSAGTSVGSLSSTASGAVNQTGAITVTGATNINAGGNAITLTSANDFQGTVSLTGGTTQITDTNSLTLGTVDTGALTTVSTGALNLGTGTVNGALSSTTNGGNITQTGALGVTGTTNLQAGAGSIVLAMANDFSGVVAASGIGIILNDVNTLAPGTINSGSGSVSLSANSLGAGGTVSAGSASSFSSNTNVNGLDINMPNVPLALSGAATQWNFTSTPTSIPQPNPVTVPGGNVGVTYNLASIIASVAQQQAASASSSVSATVSAVIVDEANKTFGTDSVAEDVEYGFAGEVGTTPPMDHRIDESGISLPRCVQESREGLPCK